MSSKTTKRARNAAAQSNAPQPKDDGTRWAVVRSTAGGSLLEPEASVALVYGTSEGTPRAEAQRLADGLLEPAGIIQIGGVSVALVH